MSSMSTIIVDKYVFSCFNGTRPVKKIDLIYRIAGHLADGDTLDEELASVIGFAVTLTHAGECAAVQAH
jgi:hypothetical protein